MSSEYLEAGLHAFILTQSAITDLTSTRISGGLTPEGEVFPALTYTTGKFDDTYSMAGESNLASATINVGCWGKTYRDAKHLFERLRDVVAGKRLTWGDYDVTCFMDGGEAEVFAAPGNEALQRFRVPAVLTVWHEQSQTVV